MLFKNLFFAVLFAGQAVSTPLVVNIEIDSIDKLSVESVRPKTAPPYQALIKMLETQESDLKALTANVTELPNSGPEGMFYLVAGLKNYGKSLIYQSTRIPDRDLTMEDTEILQPTFDETAFAMSDLCDEIFIYDDTVRKLDEDGLFYKALTTDRSAWGQFYSAMLKHLYKCSADEKKEGCEGATPFNRRNTEITTKWTATARLFRPRTQEAQLEL